MRGEHGSPRGARRRPPHIHIPLLPCMSQSRLCLCGTPWQAGGGWYFVWKFYWGTAFKWMMGVIHGQVAVCLFVCACAVTVGPTPGRGRSQAQLNGRGHAWCLLYRGKASPCPPLPPAAPAVFRSS